jgi:uncharacterized SAM-binding protein YcdF (DUF218 family)
MFFFFSKILEFFIYPLTWVLLLAFAALILKKPGLRRKMLLAAMAILLVFSDPFLLNQFAKQWDIAPRTLTGTQKYSCAIVLGGFSSELKNDTGYFNWCADRFIQALKLYETGKVSHILITGGNGSLFNTSFEEADWVRKELREFNVPDSCILTEDKSRNTLQNAAYTKMILQKSGLQPPYLLITSAFHMRRSLGIFKKEQIPVDPYPCNFMAGLGETGPGDFVPDAGTFGNWNIYTKEVVGTLVNKIR